MEADHPDFGDGGHIAANVVAFARVLRSAGLPLGPGAVLDGLAALRLVGVEDRAAVYSALQSVFITRHEHAAVFAQVFDLFFRASPNKMRLVDENHAGIPTLAKSAAAMRRAQEALNPEEGPSREREDETIEMVELAVSDREQLQRKDFAQMSAAEIAAAEEEIKRLSLPIAEIVTRRAIVDPRGRRLDLRRTLRASLRTGGDIVDLQRLGRKRKPPPIVALLDISGSMNEYTRLFLHFLHAVTDARKRVSTFLFGTRLTNVTRSLRARDPDDALAACSATVLDWSGGTRIATSLHTFNRLWSRRVLGQGAVVLLISDGLERDVDQRLAFEMDRLHRSCRKLIWLNPLLRFDRFEAKAQGIRMMLPHVDELRPIHNLSSMTELVDALSRTAHHGSVVPRRRAA
jgi:uncharacterized protein with von Willebrand factor type A (vWA) domain